MVPEIGSVEQFEECITILFRGGPGAHSETISGFGVACDRDYYFSGLIYAYCVIIS